MLYRLTPLILMLLIGTFTARSFAAEPEKRYQELQVDSYKPINIPYDRGTLSVYRFTSIFGGRGFTSTRYYVAFTDASKDKERSPPSFIALVYHPPQQAAEYFEDEPTLSDCVNTESRIFYNSKSVLVASFNREDMQNPSDDIGKPTVSVYQLQKRKADEYNFPPYYFTMVEKKEFKKPNLCSDEEIKALMDKTIQNYDRK